MLEEVVRHVTDHRLHGEDRQDQLQHREAHQRRPACGERGGGGSRGLRTAPQKAASTCSLKRGSRNAKSGLRTTYFL
jgi:hypothetical protein